MRLSIDDGELKIKLGVLETALALKRSFVIPLEHIEKTTTDPPQRGLIGIRAPGTYVPFLIRAGTYHTLRGKEFWYALRGKKHLTIELKDEPYNRIVLGLDANEEWSQRINSLFRS